MDWNWSDNGSRNLNANWNPDESNENLGVRAAIRLVRIKIICGQMSEIFQKAYDILLWIYPTVNKFPKSQRLLLAQRIEGTAVNLVRSAISLNRKDSRLRRQSMALECRKLLVLMRISKDLAWLDKRKYEHASRLIADFLKVLGGDEAENLQQFI